MAMSYQVKLQKYHEKNLPSAFAALAKKIPRSIVVKAYLDWESKQIGYR